MPWRNVIHGMLDGCIQPQSDSMRETSVSDMSILERQQARLKWQTQQQLLLQQQQNGSAFDNTSCYVHDSGFPLPVVSDPQQLTGEEDRTWMDFMQYSLMAVADPPVNLGFMGGANVCSSQPETGGAMVEVSVSGNSSCKKRKADSTNGTPKGNREMQQTTAAGPNGAEKRIKSEQDGTLMKPKQESGQKPTSSGSITTQSSKEACTADSTKQKPGKGSDVVQKTDYIHVRARRGQATDSHSLAERVRREKISERMKYLQELVPGCNKITGKAGMLDEIINYVQSLQKQVEFLSMKLAAVNPLFDTSPDCFPMTKEKACSNGIPLGIGPVPPQLLESAYFSTNPLLQMAACGLDTALNLQESAAVLNGAVTVTQPPPGVFSNTLFNPLSLSPGWNVDLQCLLNGDFQQAKASLYTSFAGVGTNNLQMHM